MGLNLSLNNLSPLPCTHEVHPQEIACRPSSVVPNSRQRCPLRWACPCDPQLLHPRSQVPRSSLPSHFSFLKILFFPEPPRLKIERLHEAPVVETTTLNAESIGRGTLMPQELQPSAPLPKLATVLFFFCVFRRSLRVVDAILS